MVNERNISKSENLVIFCSQNFDCCSGKSFGENSQFLARMLFLGILSLTVVKCRKEEGKDKDEIVLLKQNEISSLIMEAATLKKYIWSCFGQTAPAGCE